MPNITVEILPGRTDEQIREFTTVVTDAVVEILNTERGRVRVQFTEIPPNRLALGGTLIADQA
ncbi:4-oxalocrotonate tautomerase family protein [Nocardia sp. NPDC127579]|uniref:tautomerase family protein n=1 Tax=Nocardia sp. NPDC127579 TaxID=3345402 RepID=UPI003629C398